MSVAVALIKAVTLCACGFVDKYELFTILYMYNKYCNYVQVFTINISNFVHAIINMFGFVQDAVFPVPVSI